jgi:hypothetical protein
VQTVRSLVFDAMTPAEVTALRLIAEGILTRLEATG